MDRQTRRKGKMKSPQVLPTQAELEALWRPRPDFIGPVGPPTELWIRDREKQRLWRIATNLGPERTNIVNQYQERENEYLIKRQHPDVQKLVKEIRAELRNVDVYLHWALNPEEKDGGAYYCQSVIDHAHMLVDQAHEFRAALKANPPPKEDEDGEDAA